MATSASALLTPTTTFSTTISQKNPNSISFHGLRPHRLGSSSSALPKLSTTSGRRSSSAVVRAELSPSVVISLSTGLSLFLGRFVFFNFQRENVAKQVPEQNGKTHFEAGDDRAKEYIDIRTHNPINLMNNPDQTSIRLHRTHPQLTNQSINLVKHQTRSQLLDTSLTQHSMRLNLYTFNSINQNQSTITKPSSCRDFTTEVHVVMKHEE
ncbi:unnamed protein product [Eruca vesicaria subsp. sativa]|uniref:Uncharacterized protein n=1 Tax=Eruca vesicaria subsp. sativa TaxID=29727 RepID=A0ABC8KPV5_ERUVS|nr:unnamed protein product [Eruca vesicaria subsp. sativa]